MLVRTVWVCFAAAVCCGCRPGGTASGVSVGGSTGTRTWTGTAPGTGVPGLDGGGHCYFVGKLFLVWAAGTGGGGEARSGPNGVRGEGQIALRGDRKAAYAFYLPDERTGTAIFDGTEYPLAGGRVFLVRLDGDKLVVKQLDMDLSGIDLTTVDFSAVGQADPAIKAFFGAGN